MGEASQQGSWAAFAGMPRLDLMAAKEWGLVFDRIALVPYPRDLWAEAVTTLIDGFDLFAFQPATPVKPAEVERISARLRSRGSVLIVACKRRHIGLEPT